MWKGRILGLDVGSSSVKVAQAEGTPLGKRTLCRLAICNDLEELASLLALKTWWKPGDQVHISFPSDQVVVRNLRLPFRDPGKIQQTLPFELEGDIPFSVEEIVANYFMLEKGKEGSDLLALASTQQAVGAWLDRFGPLGLDPVVLEPEVAAVSHLIPECIQETIPSFCILDMGASKTNFLLFRDLRVRGVRSIPCGLGASEATLPLPQAMIREIDRTSKTLQSQGEVDQLEAVYLSGGGADIPGVTGWLEDRWGTSVRLLNPLSAMPHELAETPEAHPARFSTAIGLAMSGDKFQTCNLRAGPFVYRPGLSMFSGRALAAVILLLLAVVAGLGDLYAHLATRQKTLHALKEESHALFRQAFPGVTQIVEPALQMQRLLNERKAREFSLLGQDPRGSSVEILREISLRVQASSALRLIEFDFNGDMISLRGLADRYDTIEKAKDRWQESPFLEGVEVKTAKKNPKTQLWEFQCVARRKFS